MRYGKILYLTLCSSAAVPNPRIEIERVGSSFNGTVFNLSCTVTVSASVDTAINITTQWDPAPEYGSETVSERMRSLKREHDLTFRPLLSSDSGEYVCNATVEPVTESEFNTQVTNAETVNVTVKGKTELMS